MDVVNMKPVKAFIYQDHEAHLVTHMSFMNDPKIQQALGQNPNAQAMMGAMMAHMGEHIAFQYRKQIEDQAGVPLPPPDSDMDQNTELQISRLVAIAAQQLLQTGQAEMAQQQALQLKQGELELKKQKLAIDAAEKQDRIELEQQRIVAQKEIAGLQVGAKIATAKNTLDAKQEEAGLRLGVEIAREISQANQPPVSNAPPKETE
jgi:hypothetical protein